MGFSHQGVFALLTNGYTRAQLKLLAAGGLALTAGLKVGTIRRGGGSKSRACKKLMTVAIRSD